MARSMAGRRVRLFRCQIPPLIGPKILNAHVPKDMGWEAEIDAHVQGIWLITKDGKEHFVPFDNIQSTELYPEEQQGSVELNPEKKRLGRPPRSEAV